MAAELMIINPRRRRHRRRRMSALQRKYFGKGHGRVSSRRRRHRRRAPVEFAAANPRRRHRRSSRTLRIRRTRRNPGLLSGTGLNGFLRQLYPAGIGAAGALGVDILLGQFGYQLPEALVTPTMLPVTRLGLALGVGYVGGMVGGHEFGKNMTAGAITVTLYDLIKSYLMTNTQIPLARYVRMNRYVNGVGKGGTRRMAGLGYVGPGRQAGRMPTPVVQNVRGF